MDNEIKDNRRDMMGAPGRRSFQEVEKLEITFVTDNYSDALRPDTPIGTRYRTAPNASIHAEHGLSYFVRTHTDRRHVHAHVRLRSGRQRGLEQHGAPRYRPRRISVPWA